MNRGIWDPIIIEGESTHHVLIIDESLHQSVAIDAEGIHQMIEIDQRRRSVHSSVLID